MGGDNKVSESFALSLHEQRELFDELDRRKRGFISFRDVAMVCEELDQAYGGIDAEATSMIAFAMDGGYQSSSGDKIDFKIFSNLIKRL